MSTSTNSAYVPGLEGIIGAQTAISMVDGANGRLVYQGYVIADLAQQMSFEEVAYLLWKGQLPTKAQLEGLALELAASRTLTQAATIALDALPADTDPMDVSVFRAVEEVHPHLMFRSSIRDPRFNPDTPVRMTLPTRPQMYRSCCRPWDRRAWRSLARWTSTA